VTGPKPSVKAIGEFFLSHLDEIADRLLETFVREIPAYAALDGETLASVRLISRSVIETGSRAIQQRRSIGPSDIEMFVDSARRRARQGLPLDAILQAYRIGLLVWWDELRKEQVQDRQLADPEATQEATGVMIGYINHASTAVSEAYLDERDRLAADVERQYRLLIDALLEHGPLGETAQRASSSLDLRLAASYWVVILATEPDARTPTEMARALRDLMLPHPAVAVAQQDQVLVMWPEEHDGLEPFTRAHGALVTEFGQTIAAVCGSARELTRRGANRGSGTYVAGEGPSERNLQVRGPLARGTYPASGCPDERSRGANNRSPVRARKG
jgi:hypothetical protein